MLVNKLLSTAILAVAAAQNGNAVKVSVDPKRNSFIGSNNETLMFHGINCVGKKAPEALTDGQIDVLVNHGFNLVRLGFIWSLYEVSPDTFDEDYVDFHLDIVRRLAARDVYVYLDMHQDTWSPQYCDGHGIPEFYGWPSNRTEYLRGGKWAFPHPLAKPEYGDDDEYSSDYGLISNCGDATSTPLGWAGVYATRALSNAAQLLYDNDSGRLDKFKAFWARTAKMFMSEPNVLGYELINEPWVGDTFAKPELIVPTVSDKKNLDAFYNSLHEAIREVDDDSIILYEPSTGGNIQDTFESGFAAGPGGEAYENRNSLSFHVYCPSMQTDIGDPSQSNVVEKVCEKFNDFQLRTRAKDVQRLHTVGILSEFGAIDPNSELALKYIDHLMDTADDLLFNWNYWYIHLAEDASNPDLKTLSRTYARKVAGTISSMKFDSSTSEFNLTYLSNNANGVTEIFAQRSLYYANGIEVSIVEGCAEVESTDGNIILIRNTAADSKITLRIMQTSS